MRRPRTLLVWLAALLVALALVPADAQPAVPDGQLVARSDGALFVIQNGQKFRVYPFPADDATINALPDGPAALTVQVGNAASTQATANSGGGGQGSQSQGQTQGQGQGQAPAASPTASSSSSASGSSTAASAPTPTPDPNSGAPAGPLRVTGSIDGTPQASSGIGSIYDMTVQATVTKGGVPVGSADVSVDFQGVVKTMANTDPNGFTSGQFTVDFRGRSSIGGTINACFKGECAQWEQYKQR